MNIIFRKFLSILLVITLVFTSSYSNVFASSNIGDYPVTLPSFPDEDYPITLPSFPDEDLSDYPSNNEDITLSNDPKDVTNILQNMDIKIYQDNKFVPPGGILHFEKNLSFQYDFKVPVELDIPKPEEWVKGGDFAITSLPKGINVKSEGNRDIVDKVNNIKIGTLYFQKGLENDTMKLVFDNNLNAENEWMDIFAHIEASLQWDPTSEYTKPGERDIQIYNKTYKVVTKDRETQLTGEKIGTIDIKNQQVNWKVKVSNIFTDNQTPANLTGYVFEDNLSNVGDYVENSFKINKTDNELEAKPPLESVLSIDGNTIKYEFQNEDKNEVFIYFKTKIPDNKFFTNNINIENTAQIKKIGNEQFNFNIKGVATEELNWIKKTYIQEESKSLTKNLKWIIEINEPEYNFGTKTLKIQDNLQKNNLTFVNAKIEKYNKVNSSWDLVEEIKQEPKDNFYEITNVNEKMRLVIETNINEDLGSKPIENIATLHFSQEISASPIDSKATINIGKNPIEKSGIAYNTKTREITWNVKFHNVNEAYGTNLLLLDLLIYDEKIDESLGNITIDTDGLVIPELDYTTIINQENFPKSFNQSYSNFEFKNGNGKLNVLKVMQNGKQIGDLIIVTNENGNYIGNNDSLEFNIKTIVNKPSQYAINANTEAFNSISIFSQSINKVLFTSKANKYINSKVVNKDMISRSASKELEKDFSKVEFVNGANPGVNGVFDYVDKTATFRIHVNSNETDLKNLGAITVQDVMPEGWERKDIGTEPFLLYEGVKQQQGEYQGFVTAQTYIPKEDYESFLTLEENGRNINFNFTGIDKAYVIIVKIGLTDEKIEETFSKNQSYNGLRNDGNFKYNGTNLAVSNDWENFNYRSNILTKQLLGKDEQNGILSWSVDYKSYGIKRENIRLRDSLPYGIELVRDKQGNLIYGDNGINAYELDFDINGNYTKSKPIENLQQYIEYDFEERNLILNFPDPSKSYKLVYKTEITGEIGEVKNQVYLEGLNVEIGEVSGKYQITKDDVSASARRGAKFDVVTVSNEDENIENIEFSLYPKDSENIVRQGITKEVEVDGKKVTKTTIRAVPEGEYVLKETSQPPAEFTPNNREANIKVVDNGGGNFDITVDDKPIEQGGIEFIHYNKNSVGNLKISKTVVDEPIKSSKTEIDKSFEFTLTLENDNNLYNYKIYNNNNIPILDGKIGNGGKFNLKHNEYIIIENIPEGVNYKVVEKDYTEDNFHAIYEPSDEGIIQAGKESTINVVNTLKGMLSVKKEVDGKDAELNRKFDFKLVIDNYDATNKSDYLYEIVKNDNPIEKGRITKSEFDFQLAHDETFYVLLPLGASYKVTENESIFEEYKLTTIGETIGKIDKNNLQVDLLFTNTKIQKGNLKLIKEVTGENADLNKDFKFKIELNTNKTFNYESNRPDNQQGQIKNGSIVTLKNNEYILIKDIPEGTKYKIEEEDYTQDYYQTIYKSNNEGNIVGNTNNIVQVENIYTLKGMLSIKKEVDGKDAELDRQFDFKLNINNFDNSINDTYDYLYTIVRNDMTIEKGYITESEFNFKLAHNDTIYILLPLETNYEVTESEKVLDDYTLTTLGKTSGKIDKNNLKVDLLFKNTKIQKGDLKLVKEVTGEGADLNKDFKFKVELNTNKTFNYESNRLDNQQGQIKNGDIVLLKNNEYITIKDIPEGIEYKISEDIEVSKEYDIYSENEEGLIISNEVIEVKFVNQFKKVNNGGGNSGGGGFISGDKNDNVNKDTDLKVPPNENNETVEVEIDESGNIIERRIGERYITEEVKDKDGNIVKTIIKDKEQNNITEVTTDEQGNIIEVIKDKDGNIIKTTIKDKQGNITEVTTDEQGNIIEVIKDKDGNIVKTIIKDEQGNIIEMITNEKGNITETEENNNAQVKSDNDNNKAGEVKSSLENNSNIPKTGDEFNLSFYLRNILISSILLLFVLFTLKNKKA